MEHCNFSGHLVVNFAAAAAALHPARGRCSGRAHYQCQRVNILIEKLSDFIEICIEQLIIFKCEFLSSGWIAGKKH